MSDPLRVLFVDDEDPSSSTLVASELRKKKWSVDAKAMTPDKVEEEDLHDRDLILVDYVLDEGWKPAQAPAVQRPANGLAVASVIRSLLPKGHSTGVALFSAELDRLAEHLVTARQEHVVARLYGLEWAFAKTPPAGVPTPPERIISLAKAVRSFSSFGPTSGNDAERVLAGDLLGLPLTESWSPLSLRQLEASQSPTDELLDAGGSLVALRWLALRLLPYPGALIESAHAAALLGIDLKYVSPENGLGEALSPYRYKGALADLLGPRWWRAGIEYQVGAWEPSGLPVPSDVTVKAASELLGESVEPRLGMVACIDEDFEATTEIAPKPECVRVRPDDWPVFALPGWMRIEAIQANAELAKYVDPADRELLKQ